MNSRRRILVALAATLAAPAAFAQSFDLGSRWSVTEYSSAGFHWNGVWTRVGPNTFSAFWRSSRDGQTVRDTIRFVGLRGNEVTLYRSGQNGRYYGRLSPDGRTIEGLASWYKSGDYWTASIQ